MRARIRVELRLALPPSSARATSTSRRSASAPGSPTAGRRHANAEACVDPAFELGINFIDTANVYGRGAAEEFLGDALAERPRDSYVLATKLFFPMTDQDRGLSRAQIEKQIDASLARLRTDYVDLYQCHRYDAHTPLEETMQALTQVVRRARRATSASASGRPSRSRPRSTCRASSASCRASRSTRSSAAAGARRDPALRGERHLADRLVAARAGRADRASTSPARRRRTDSRAASERWAGRWTASSTDDVLAAVQRLRPLADGLGITMAQLALAWVLREPNVASAIVGAIRPAQVEDNAAASGVELDDVTLEAIDDALVGHSSRVRRRLDGPPDGSPPNPRPASSQTCALIARYAHSGNG